MSANLFRVSSDFACQHSACALMTSSGSPRQLLKPTLSEQE